MELPRNLPSAEQLGLDIERYVAATRVPATQAAASEHGSGSSPAQSPPASSPTRQVFLQEDSPRAVRQVRYQAPRDRIARVAHRIVQGAAALGTGRSRSRPLARQRGASAGSAATATDEGDSNYNYNDVELNPMYERFFVQAYAVRADRFKVCAPGHPVWLDPAETST